MKPPEQLETPTDFRDFFEAIPDEKWTTGKFIDKEGERCCARGHLGDFDEIDEAPSVCERLEGVLESVAHATRQDADQAVLINDGLHPKYQQKTPKARILAALDDVINATKGTEQ